MTAKFIHLLPLATLVFALAGCSPHPTGIDTTEAAGDSIPLFKEGKGILFSAETEKLVGVEIADATERPMQRRLERTAEVYRAAHGEKPGGALVLCSADEAKDLTTGQTVSLRPVSALGSTIPGTLARLDLQTHATLGHMEVVIEFADPMQTLAAGAFVTASFTSGEPRNVLSVPTSALLLAADGSYVYTVNGTHLTRTRVKTGTTSEGFVAIEDGLYAGDAVAVRGIENLWLVELSALKGGTPCCPVPKKDPAK